MTKAQLALYDFNSIEFTQDGEPCHGFLSYDPLRGLFAIVYSVIEQEGEKRRTLELRDDQIERIVYDEAAEILILA